MKKIKFVLHWPKLRKPPAPETQEDRREVARVRPEDVFLLEFRKAGLRTRRLGEVKDFTSQGIRFATPLSLRKNERLRLWLYFPKTFPGPRKKMLRARVMRVLKPTRAERFRVGCLFEEGNDEAKETLRQFIYWLSTKY